MSRIQQFLDIPAGVIETPQEEALLGLLRTSEMILQHARRTLFADGISQAQFNILMILDHESDAGVSQSTIGRRLITTKGNLSQHIAQMESKGLIRRRPAGDDRRCNVVRLTARGRRVLARLEPRYRAQVARILALDSGELSALIRGTDKVRDNLLAARRSGGRAG